MKKLCDKQGNGICTNCTAEFESTVLCRNKIATYTAYKDEAIEDMINHMLYKGLFNTREEVLENFGL